MLVYCSIAEGGGKGGRGAASGLWQEGSLCNILSVMLGGDVYLVRVRVS